MCGGGTHNLDGVRGGDIHSAVVEYLGVDVV